MMREKNSYSFSRSLVKGQGHSFFKDLTGVFCTFGGTRFKLFCKLDEAIELVKDPV
jgi:hypothetical protein